jgi:subtilisin family serine protease
MSHPLARPQGSSGRPLTLERLEDRTLPSGTPATLDLSGLHVDPGNADLSNILVQFRPGSAAVALPGTTLSRALDLVPGLYEVRLAAGRTVERALQEYRQTASVLIAQPNDHLDVSWVPNDPQLRQQWDLSNTGQNNGTPGADIHAPSAWNVATNSRRVPVAVIDSGIDYTHPDLYQNIWLNQAEIPTSRRANLKDVDGDGLITFRDLNNRVNIGPGKITDLNGNGYIDAGDILQPMQRDAQGRDTGRGGWAYPGNTQDGDTAHPNDFIGWNFVNNTNNPFDDFGHGTHLAGVIGAMGNNGVGVAGIDWQAQLVPVKFFDSSGNGTVSQFIDGLNWALSKGIKVSNNSWTDSAFSPVLYEAVQRARDLGHIFVAAAGNDARNTDAWPTYPANLGLDNVLSVAATDRNDKLAGFSNWGPTSVSIAAPGVDILSTLPWGGYGVRTGTSMAAPHVAAVVAMVWALRPEWSYRQVIAWVMQTADRLPGLAGKVASGRLNAAAAFRVPARGALLPSAILAKASSAPAGATIQTQPVATSLAEIAGILARREKERE